MLSLLITLIFLPYASSQLSSTLQQHIEFKGPSPSNPLKARPTTVYRPRSLEALHRTRLRSLYDAQSELEPLIWDPVTISGPDIEDLHTLTQLARMSGNAYALPGQKNWYDIDDAWNSVRPLLFDFLLFCPSLSTLHYRVFHMVGRLRTDLGVMPFYPLTIPLLYSP